MSGGGLIARLERGAERFAELLRAEPGAVERPFPDFLALAQAQGALKRPARWRNVLLDSPTLARAHVEYFELIDQLAVVHVCVFHRAAFAAPVFGFDVIVGAEKATGVFLDLSPTSRDCERVVQDWASAFADRRSAFETSRALPPWGDIFSDHVLAVRPRSAEEVERALELALMSVRWLLSRPARRAQAPQEVAAGQARYVAGQRRNEHTLRVLRTVVGEALARRFVDEWLFPEIADAPARLTR